jgi:hypothetical protein
LREHGILHAAPRTFGREPTVIILAICKTFLGRAK